MSAQIFQDVVVIGEMFLLRIGLPLLIVMGAGYLIRRWLEPKVVQEQFEGIVRTAQERRRRLFGNQLVGCRKFEPQFVRLGQQRKHLLMIGQIRAGRITPRVTFAAFGVQV